MKTLSTLCILVLFASSSLFSQIDWLRQSSENPASPPSPGTAISHDIVLGSGGGTYITGNFSGESKFDQVQFPASPYNSMFIAKYRNDGTLSWAKRMLGNGNNQSWAIAANDSQHVYIAGEYRQTNANTILDFGDTITLEGNGSPSSFLAKYDSSGNIMWARRMLATPLPGQQHEAIARDIKVDPAGNIYVLGDVADSVQIEGTWYNTGNTGSKHFFIAKFRPDGSLDWFKHTDRMGGAGVIFVNAGHLEIGSQGQLYVNGEFGTLPILNDILGWDGDTLLTGLEGGQFLARFDADGNIDWWQSMSAGSGPQFPRELGVDALDNVYLNMRKYSHFEFNDGQVNGNSYKGHAMLLKYSPTGNREFIKAFAHGDIGSSSDVWNASMTLHTMPSGTTIISGRYGSISSSEIVFGNRDTFPMPNATSDGPRQFLAGFDASGNYLDVGFLVDTYPTAPNFYWENTAMTSDENGMLYMTGKFGGRLGLGADTLGTPSGASAGGQTFAVKFDPSGLLDLTTSLDDEFSIAHAIKMYPNPAQEWVMIDLGGLPKVKQAEVQLFNLQGQLVLSKMFTGNKHQLSTTGLHQGYYLCQILVDGKRGAKRLYVK